MVGLGNSDGDWWTVSLVGLDYKNSGWWMYLEETMRDLVQESMMLLEREEKMAEGLHDYSFVVFPMAKAYEGFLKKLFLDMGLITNQQYNGEHFRIGKALNPNLPKRYRSGWVFGKLSEACKGETMPLKMWEAWKRGRNRIFHFFPDHHEFISLEEAKNLIWAIAGIMEEALAGCKTPTTDSANSGSIEYNLINN